MKIIKAIITGFVLIFLYFMATFPMTIDNSVSLQILVHLIVGSIVAFLVFKKDSKHIKKGLIFSVIILASMYIINYLLGNVIPSTNELSDMGNIVHILSLIENPLIYAITFLICFNIPFIAKQFISKKYSIIKK